MNDAQKLKELERRFKSILITLPVLAGNEAVNFALDNFQRQGFLGNSLNRWKARKNPTRWGTSPKRNGRSILVDTGRLRRSIRVVRVTTDSVTIGTDVPYAKAHNEGSRLGLIQTVKAHTRKRFEQQKVYTIKRKKEQEVKVQTGTIQVMSHTRKINQNIPKRQFIGPSAYLNAKLKRIITAEIMKALRYYKSWKQTTLGNY